ncbi:TPA: hypothetical protein HA241_00790 [Candidatus Woesearchaeota archaeon]|nr:hypothetical protein [Candidatus Woesearchaeota archaeon]
MVLFDLIFGLFFDRKPNFTKKIPRLKAEWDVHKNELVKFPPNQQARLEAWGKRLWKKLESAHFGAQQIITKKLDQKHILAKADELFEPLDEEIDSQRERVEENLFRDPPPIQRWREMVLRSIEKHLEKLDEGLESCEK